MILTRLATHLADRYRIDDELGRGGMAIVYRAHDLRHDRPVALKVLRPELSASIGAERFLREIRFAAQLQHPHILPVLDSGEVPPEPGAEPAALWFAMPLVEGESLRDRLRRAGPQPVDDVVRWTRELADALAYAHERGIVHRDIKPENILLSRDHALLADFGVARALEVTGQDRLTDTGLALGTPAYMSPEQATADPGLDGRADLYSLGCVLFELLAGEPPYTGPTAQSIVAKRLTDPVPSVRRLRETVPPKLDHLIQRLLAKLPADRFATRHGPAVGARRSRLAPAARAFRAVAHPDRVRPPCSSLLGLVFAAGVVRRRAHAATPLDPQPSPCYRSGSLRRTGRSTTWARASSTCSRSSSPARAGAHAVPPAPDPELPALSPRHDVSSEAGIDAARRAGAGLMLDGTAWSAPDRTCS